MSRYSKKPSFKEQPADTPISEIALRVLVEFEGGETHAIGTATVIAGHLAISAKHIFEDITKRFGARKKTDLEYEISEYAVRLYQILPGPQYAIWNVLTAWPCVDTDIAILHLGLHGFSSDNPPVSCKVPRLRVVPPPVGDRVVGFGYHSSRTAVRHNPDGSYHLDLNDKPTATVGEVIQVHPSGRDPVMYPFPCFRVNARFDGGMSGGPILDDTGLVCGIISGTLPPNDPAGEAASYVPILWPMLRTVISADRGDRYPRGIKYPVIDLALDGIIAVVGLEQLDPTNFPDRVLSR